MAREPLAVTARNRFLGFHEELKRLLGSNFRPYKTLEVERLDRAFNAILRSRKRGAVWVCETIARLSWDQTLPNINHRTTLGFLQAVLAGNEVEAPWVARRNRGPEYEPSTQEWMKKSKAIMADRDMWNPDSKPWKELQKKHQDATCAWLAGLAQSGSLASTGPHLLKNFLSSAVSEG